MNFKQWLLQEARAPYVYHVTLLKHIDDIANDGLSPNAPNNNWQGYQYWSQGKNFFSSNIGRVNYWINQIKDLVNHDYESGLWDENNFVNHEAIPVILRFRFNTSGQADRQFDSFANSVNKETRDKIWPNRRWGYDKEGMKAGPQGNDFYSFKTIPPHGIEQWDGTKWSGVGDYAIDPLAFVEKTPVDDGWREELEDEGIPSELHFYWEWKNPYPYPKS